MTTPVDRLAEALKDRYTLERELGAGGMATVYLAHDLKHDRNVAIKVLRPELAAVLGAERFLREIRIAAQLQHPHILPLHDSGQVGSLLYYVMPLVEGESLRNKLDRERQLSVRDAVRLLRDVVDALSHAHIHGVVHRDIKPDNVLLSGRHALVSDFGVAKALTEATGREQMTTVGVAVGTPTYMAPEQVAADPHLDHRVDIYAAGVLAYEMLVGQPPFRADTPQGILAAHMTKAPDPVDRRRSGIPGWLTSIVMRCLEKQPDDRWQSAESLLEAIEARLTPETGTTATRIRTAAVRSFRGLRRHVSPVRIIGVLLAIGVLGYSNWTLERRGRIRWARQEAIPTLQRLTEDAEWEQAYALASQARAVIPDDSVLASLWATLSGPVSVRSQPTGAQVYRRDYSAVDAPWEFLGTTPLDSVRIPRARPSYSRFRIVKAGFDTLDDVVWPRTAPWSYVLDPIGSTQHRMVRIPAGPFAIVLAGIDNLESVVLGEYFIDRYEVTNQEFKSFVDSGGYRRRDLWEYPFVKDGKPVSWSEAMSQFRDKTGRSGPSTWEAGDYPDGQGNMPVTGISWFEAAAFAAFTGKQLPTIFHWSRAALIGLSSAIVPLSNMRGRRGGPAAVGTFQGMSASGAMDMAGNVREWVFNEGGPLRYLLGGCWEDSPDLFTSAYAADPFDRSSQNGVRLASYPTHDSMSVQLRRPIPQLYRDFRAMTPASDVEYAAYVRRFDYDRTPLDALIEEADSSNSAWIEQRVTFNAAYGGERMAAYLFLPRNRKAPFQTVVFFPGDGTLAIRSSENLPTGQFDFVLKSGRAVIYPIYKGTYERGDGLTNGYPNQTIGYAEHVFSWGKDLKRSIDYLDTRADIDTEKLGYYGNSWGGLLGGIMLAIEPRFKAGVLSVAGLAFQKSLPEAEPVNYLPHVTVPTLMLDGRYDFFFPVETSQKPMFELLGTRAEDKRHVIAEGSHFVPRPLLIRETLDWLDRYLGPVR